MVTKARQVQALELRSVQCLDTGGQNFTENQVEEKAIHKSIRPYLAR